MAFLSRMMRTSSNLSLNVVGGDNDVSHLVEADSGCHTFQRRPDLPKDQPKRKRRWVHVIQLYIIDELVFCCHVDMVSKTEHANTCLYTTCTLVQFSYDENVYSIYT